jgi:hypothetical protein
MSNISDIAVTLSGLAQPTTSARTTVAGSSPVSGTRAEGNLDYVGFTDLLYSMLKVDCPDTFFVPAFPKYLKTNTRENKETMDNPIQKFKRTITYRVIRREPATIGGNKEPFGTGQKDLKPKERMRIGNPDGTQTIIYGQRFDNLIRFNIWCLTNTEAEALVNWFEQYLRTRRAFLRNMGLDEILFWSREEDKTAGDFDNRLEMRSLTFFTRTEELSSAEESVLKNLEIQLGIRTTNQ